MKLLNKYFRHRRRGLICPPKRAVLARIEPPCAIEFMQTVGADLHIRPKVPSCITPTATRHQIMVTVNKMDRMDCLYRHNALGRIYKSTPTVGYHKFNGASGSVRAKRYFRESMLAFSYGCLP